MRDLTTGHIGGQILKFAAPLMMGNLLQQTYYFIDSIIVGQLLGKEALAAVSASFSVIFVLVSLVIGISAGGTIIISQYFGAGDKTNVRRTIDTLYIFVFFASIIITTLGISISRPVFQLTRLPDDVLPQAVVYLNTILLGTIMVFGFNGTSAILRGLGDPVTPLVFLVLSSVTNILLDLLLIRYFSMGIAGAAWATVISQGLAFFLAVFYLNKNHKIVQLRLKELIFDRKIFRQSIRIGLPTGLQQTFVSLGMLALFRIVDGFGTNVIAAYAAAGRIDNLAMLPSMNFGQALSSFVGQNIGAKKETRVRKGLLSTLGMSSVVSIVITLLVIMFRRRLIGLFTSDPEVIHIGGYYLMVVGSCYVIFSVMFSMTSMLRGAGATLMPMFITLLSLWFIRIPCAAIFSGTVHPDLHIWGNFPLFHKILSGNLKETGIWIAVPLGWFSGAIFSYIYYLSGKWRYKGIVSFAS